MQRNARADATRADEGGGSTAKSLSLRAGVLTLFLTAIHSYKNHKKRTEFKLHIWVRTPVCHCAPVHNMHTYFSQNVGARSRFEINNYAPAKIVAEPSVL
jgi:hypothetical protein